MAAAGTKATSEANRRRWRRALTVLSGTSMAIWIGALGFLVYMAPIRPAPDVAAGRVYGWPEHGTYVYLSRWEDLAVKGAMALAVVLFVTVAAIERKLDPWQRRLR